MIHRKLSSVVKVVRLRYAVLVVLLLVAFYLTAIQPWMANWGSTAAERQMVLPGDDLIPHRSGKSTLAITINAPADVIWQWLVQVGQDRAGFYTYTWLENLVGANIHNTDEIRPEWQHLAVGDSWRLVPVEYLWGLGKGGTVSVLIVEPGHTLVLEMFGAHVLVPVDKHTTRLIVRGESGPTNLLITMVWKPIVFTLERRMLLGLKARAEGRPDAPPVLMAIAQLGWVAAGITVAGLFLSQRRRRFWIVLPVVAALPALLMGSDVQAGLAAFLGVGISLLGFLVFGRSWLGSFLVIGSVVLLTLLLAPEAYTAIGLAFAVLLLAALGGMVAARFRNADDAARKLVTPTMNIILAFLQTFIALTALAGGFMFVKDPSGAAMGFHVSMLEGSIFPNYLIPGLFLLLVNGLGSLIGALLSYTRNRNAGPVAIALGATLLAWLVIQMIAIRTLNWVQGFYFLLGLVELALGMPVAIKAKPYRSVLGKPLFRGEEKI